MKGDVKQLRVRPTLPPPEKGKITFKLPAPTIARFNSYLAAFSDTYGVKADPDFIANEIFSAFFDSDRAFAAYLQKDAAEDEPSGGGGRALTGQTVEPVR